MESAGELANWLSEHESRRKAKQEAQSLREMPKPGMEPLIPWGRHFWTDGEVSRPRESDFDYARRSLRYKTSTVVIATPRQLRAMRRSEAKFTAETKALRFGEERGICQWCHKIIEGEWHAHHITPIVDGGGSSPDNLMVLHAECHLDPEIYPILHNGRELPKGLRLEFRKSTYRPHPIHLQISDTMT